jgi:thiamine biosynthesis lipoprotein
MPYLVAPVMGTTVSIDVRDEGVPATALEAAVETLRELEARFTTYHHDSEIRRVERGDLVLADAHPDVRRCSMPAPSCARRATGRSTRGATGASIPPAM